MSIRNNDSIEKYTPLILVKSQTGLRTLSEEEVIGYIMFQAETNRKKPGFFKRKGEHIRLVSLLYYPFIVKSYRERMALIIDPVKKSSMELEYDSINKEVINKELESLKDLTGKEFLDQMVKLEKIVESIVSGKEYIDKRKYVIESIVNDAIMIKDLRIFIENTVNYEIPGGKIEYEKINIDEIIEKVQKILEETHSILTYINDFIKRLDGYVDKWKENIELVFSEKMKEIDVKIEETKLEVQKNINLLRKKLEEEINVIKERHKPTIETIEKRIDEIKSEIKTIEEEIEKAKQYGKDTSDLKKKLNDLKKTLKDLEEELREANKRMEDEIESVQKRYKEMIESENEKIKRLYNEREKLRLELEALEKEANTRYDSIRKNLMKYRDKIMEIEKKILGISVLLPTSGEGKYLVPLAVIMYGKNSETRYMTITPLMFEHTGRIASRIRIYSVESINKHLAWIINILEQPRIRAQLDENNLFRIVTLERIEIGLSRLSDLGILSRGEIRKIIKNLKDQIEMVV